jgi:hypothetical protein
MEPQIQQGQSTSDIMEIIQVLSYDTVTLSSSGDVGKCYYRNSYRGEVGIALKAGFGDSSDSFFMGRKMDRTGQPEEHCRAGSRSRCCHC